MSELPANWVTGKIGQLCDLRNGRAFKPAEWSVTGLPIVRIQNLNKRAAPFNFYNGEYSDKYHLMGGELLFAWSGTPGTSFGSHIWYGGEALLNQHIFRVDFDAKNMDRRFFRLAINQKLNELINVAHGGVGLRHVTKGNFEATEISIPPFKEQKRIADKLDALLMQVDACRNRLDKIPGIIKRFRQAVLAAAFTGKLTTQFRNTSILTPIARTIADTPMPPRPNRYASRTSRLIMGDYALAVGKPKTVLPIGWQWVPLVDIAKMESGHTPSRAHPEYWENGTIPWVGIADARDGHGSTIFDAYQKTNELGLANSAARLLPAGTVCFSRTASVGYVVRMGTAMATSQDFANWICTVAINPDWLKFLFVAENAAIYRFGKGSTHTTVYFPELLALHVALPSIEEQAEIVRRVEALFAFADRLEARYTTARAQVENLTPALLAKAFRGELVPQDPNDEPASALLARIRDARAAPEKVKTPRASKA
jgi:type I restriction enzyme S subunit